MGNPESERGGETKPTQIQLGALKTAAENHEIHPEPLEDIPADVDLTTFNQLTAPPPHDENHAPMATLRAQDGRIIRLALFRQPDNNQLIQVSVDVIERSQADTEFPLFDEERFLLDARDPNSLRLTRTRRLHELGASDAEPPGDSELEEALGLNRITGQEVDDLIKLLEGAEAFNPFDKP